MDQILDKALHENQEAKKRKGYYCLADTCVEVSSIHECVHDYCADYDCHRCKKTMNNDCSGKPDILVSISQADIDYEKEKSAAEDRMAGLPVRQYSDRYLETLAVYRQIAEQMPAYDTFLIHGSAVAVDEPSGQ